MKLLSMTVLLASILVGQSSFALTQEARQANADPKIETALPCNQAANLRLNAVSKAEPQNVAPNVRSQAIQEGKGG